MTKPRAANRGAELISKNSLAQLTNFLVTTAQTPTHPHNQIATKCLLDFARQLGGKA
jgi:hypothetical protein